MGRHFVRALLAMCVMALVTAGACVVKRGHRHRDHSVTHAKHKKHHKQKKQAKKHKKQRKNRKHHDH